MNKLNLIFVLALVTALATGCATTGPKNVERDFGNSVRNMVQSQTLDPATARNPDREAVDSGDGERLDNVLDAYRGDVAEPKDVGQPLVINVGSN